MSRGRVYLGTGNVLAGVLNPLFVPGPGSLVALGVAGPADVSTESVPARGRHDGRGAAHPRANGAAVRGPGPAVFAAGPVATAFIREDDVLTTNAPVLRA